MNNRTLSEPRRAAPKKHPAALRINKTRASVGADTPWPEDDDEWPSTLDALRERFKSLGRILDRTELASLPKPKPLIEGWVDTRTTVVMVGATGTNKTFTLIGWACSTVTGEPWLGHEVKIKPCPVIYVVGEGASGFDDRIAAWESEHDVKVPRERCIFMLLPNSLVDKDFWGELRVFALEVGARLVILDTFSSLAPDADETTDAAAVVRYMTHLSGEIDGSVVLAHHTGWGQQNRARGGSQLESNPDGIVVLQKIDAEDPNSVVSVWRKKDKDGPSGKTIHVSRLLVEKSCVLELVDAPPKAAKSGSGSSDAEVSEAILEYLDDRPDQSTKTDVLTNVASTTSTTRAGTDRLREAWSRLEEGQLIRSCRVPRLDKRGRDQGATVWARATPEESKIHIPASAEPGPKPQKRGDR